MSEDNFIPFPEIVIKSGIMDYIIFLDERSVDRMVV